MRRDKALLDWHGQTLLEHMVQLLSSATERVRVAGCQSLPDLFPNRGPLSGILTALESSETDASLVVAVDLPFLTPRFLKHLRSQLETSNRPLLTCRVGSRFPLCMGVSRRLVPELRGRVARGELKVHRFIEDSGAEIITELELCELGFDLSMFQNINSEQDYRRALSSSNQ